METFDVVGYSHWASFIFNNDASSLDADDAAELAAWAKANDIYPCNALNCSDESFFDYPDGGDFLKGDCVTYTFAARRK